MAKQLDKASWHHYVVGSGLFCWLMLSTALLFDAYHTCPQKPLQSTGQIFPVQFHALTLYTTHWRALVINYFPMVAVVALLVYVMFLQLREKAKSERTISESQTRMD